MKIPSEPVFNQFLLNYEINWFAQYFSERIVPRAVLYFTGEALEEDSDYDEEDSEEDSDEEGKE